MNTVAMSLAFAVAALVANVNAQCQAELNACGADAACVTAANYLDSIGYISQQDIDDSGICNIQTGADLVNCWADDQGMVVDCVFIAVIEVSLSFPAGTTTSDLQAALQAHAGPDAEIEITRAETIITTGFDLPDGTIIDDHMDALKAGVAEAWGVSANDVTITPGRRRLAAVGSSRRQLAVRGSATLAKPVGATPPEESFPTRDRFGEIMNRNAPSVGPITADDPADADVRTETEFKATTTPDKADAVNDKMEDKSGLAGDLGVSEDDIQQQQSEPVISSVPSAGSSPPGASGATSVAPGVLLAFVALFAN